MSLTPTLAHEIALYLRAHSREYPGGILRSMLTEKRLLMTTSKHHNIGAAPKLLFVCSGVEPQGESEQSPLAGAGGELLKAAIEKGLKMPLAEVAIALARDGPVLRKEIEAQTPRIIVALGSAAFRALFPGEAREFAEVVGKWVSLGATPVIASLDPREVARNPELKKALWRDLKVVLEKLSAQELA